MQVQKITAGVAAAQVSFTGVPTLGVKLLARTANAGTVFLGTASDVTTATGVPVPKGDPGTVDPFVVPAEHFKGGTAQVWLVASEAAQLVDVVSQ